MKKLRKLSKGIYRDAHSIRAIVDVAAGRTEKRFALDTPLEEMKRWREETKVKLNAKARRRPSRAGTLRVDVPRYLAMIKGQVSQETWKSRRSELDAWLALYGDRPRGALTEEHIGATVAKWRTLDDSRPPGRGNPCSVRTCEHRVAALRHLFRTLDGPDTVTPCDAMTFDLPKTRPVLVSPIVIRRVAAKLTHQDTRARHMVLSSTGARPAELMRTDPDHDVHLRARYWVVRTAKGGEDRVIWLNADMLAAWKYFLKVRPPMKYDTSTHAKRLYAAGWPRGVRPYNTRATFGMELSRRGADLHDIQQLLGHTDAKTTRAYYVPPEQSRLAAASRSVGRRLGWDFLSGRLGSGRKQAKKR